MRVSDRLCCRLLAETGGRRSYCWCKVFVFWQICCLVCTTREPKIDILAVLNVELKEAVRKCNGGESVSIRCIWAESRVKWLLQTHQACFKRPVRLCQFSVIRSI